MSRRSEDAIPEQPSAEETKKGVRLVLKAMGVAGLIYLLVQPLYAPDSYLMVRSGKPLSYAGVMHKAVALDEEALRAHPGGRVLWLVGSSILRDSFDVAVINQALAEANHPFRVSKFGQSRGATLLSYGLLRHLPLREGDWVMHSLTAENYYKGWIERFGVDHDMLHKLIGLEKIWELPTLSPQQKIERSIAWPIDFFANHRFVEKGLGRLQRRPADPNYPNHYNTHEFNKHLEKARQQKPGSKAYLNMQRVSFEPPQVNVLALDWMRELLAEKGVALTVAQIPPRCEYESRFIDDALAVAWKDYKEAQGVRVFPRAPDDDYADMFHPNFRGRKIMTQALIDWLLGGADSNAQDMPIPGAPRHCP